MSKFVIIAALALITTSAVTARQNHDQHAQMNQRGGQVMGFDQEKTTHHFYLYSDGGAIDVAVNDAADRPRSAPSRLEKITIQEKPELVTLKLCCGA